MSNEQSILTLLKKASQAYYDGEPILTNEQYDALEAKSEQIIAGRGEIPHTFRMYSLQKTYDLSNTPFPVTGDTVKTPKLDGAAVSVLYVNGTFTEALTRGDGIKGRDITEKMSYLVPDTIPIDLPIVQITGEVVCHKDTENARNYCSGALNQKDIEVFKQRKTDGKMQFVAYQVQHKTDSVGLTNSYSEDLAILSTEWNLLTVKSINDDIFPLDGYVYRIDDNRDFDAVGYTAKFPRGAFAYKQNAEGVETVLLDVIWQTGKTGKVTPVAILEPVMVGDAQVQRATLNNQAFIEALDLELGCKVKVVRSGEIIPCITERVY